MAAEAWDRALSGPPSWVPSSSLWTWLRRRSSFSHRVNVDQLKDCRFQTLLHDAGKALQDLITEIVVVFALRTQTLAVKGNRAHGFNGVGVKPPLVRRQQPRPAQNLSLAEGGEHDRLALRGKDFECHLAGADQVELVRFASLLKDVGAGVKADVRGAPGQQVGVIGLEIGEERVFGDDVLKGFHDCGPSKRRVFPGWREPPQ